jgi:hypothetical protein
LETAEVELPRSVDIRMVAETVLQTCKARGLAVSVKTSLKSYPGSIHWHFKKGPERGVVEVTFWAAKRRLWINVHSNRTGPWTAEEMRGLKADLEKQFRR